jgi:hypothetical protein
MGQLIHQGDLRPSGEHRIEVHLLKTAAPVLHYLARNDLQVADQRLGQRPAMAFDEPDHDVGAPLLPPVALVEHGVGLPDARGRAQVDPEATGRLNRVAGIADSHLAFSRRSAHAFHSGLVRPPRPAGSC